MLICYSTGGIRQFPVDRLESGRGRLCSSDLLHQAERGGAVDRLCEQLVLGRVERTDGAGTGQAVGLGNARAPRVTATCPHYSLLFQVVRQSTNTLNLVVLL